MITRADDKSCQCPTLTSGILLAFLALTGAATPDAPIMGDPLDPNASLPVLHPNSPLLIFLFLNIKKDY